MSAVKKDLRPDNDRTKSGIKNDAGRAPAHAPAWECAVAADEMARLVALFNAGQYAELENRTRMLIEQSPQAGFLWKVLGVALKTQGKDALAALKRATQLLPNDAESHSNLGLALQDAGQLDAAVASCRRAIAIRSDLAVAHNNLSNALRELRQLDGAERSARHALAISPDMAEAHHSLGVALRNQGYAGAAEASCRRALEINPDLPGVIAFLGELQVDQGKFPEAAALFRRAIALKPESPEAWAGIAAIRKMTHNDIGWLKAAQKFADHAATPRTEVRLRYAIGKYYDDVNEFDQAFDNYRRANELSKQYGAKYDRKQQTLAIDTLTRIYDQRWTARKQADIDSSARPVFIVGMPRSGTSLAEQILASHPAVFGAGELGFWKGAAARHASGMLKGQLGTEALATLRQDYLATLQGFSADALRVVDKMPDNFLHLGLIHAAFPNARIIHMQRNPIDTCLSIYFQHFNAAHAYANDLSDLAHYYTEYFRVMEHWRATLPAQSILHVPYEGLVEDQEGWSRTMLDFIDLPWDARCIDFHQCVRTVSTASNWQVRQKITKSSVMRWRNYEKFVGPLQGLMELERTGVPEQQREQPRNSPESMQLLGNILRRVEQSLRFDDLGREPSLFEPATFNARRAAELAFSLR